MIGNKEISAILPPVFIIGAGRSGTTLLYKMLCLHSDIAWISNYNNRFPNFFFISFINRMNHHFKRNCCRIWFSKNSNAYFSDRNQIKRIFPMPIEGETIYKRCGIPTFPDRLWKISEKQKKCIITSFEKLRFYQGAIVFLNKRTANNRRIKQLIETFPKAKFIHIIRDGRAVAFSLLNVKWWLDHKVWWWGLKTPREWEAEGNNPLVMAARNWVEEIKEIQFGLKNVPSEQLFEVRYEELPSKKLEILTKAIKFMGINDLSGWIESIKTLSIRNNNSAWKEKSCWTERDILKKIQSDALKQLGYM